MGSVLTVLAFIFVIGLCIGSFLNVVILRTLSEESIVFPASKCPKCQTPLKWWHNIPVISYICLRGKCAFCKEPISIQYPLIELFTAIIFTLLFIKFGLSFDTLFYWIYSALLIVIAGTDIKEKVVFDKHTFSLIGTGLLYSLILTALFIFVLRNPMPGANLPNLTLIDNPLTSSILGALAGAIIMEIFARVGYLVAGTRAFGEGDTLIAAGLGTVLGWKMLIISLVLGVAIQAIMFLPIFFKSLVLNKNWKTLITFISFIIYAAGFFTLQQLNIITAENFYIYLICTLLLGALGLIACVFILKGLKENPGTYLPFGPAMVLAGFLMILFFSS